MMKCRSAGLALLLAANALASCALPQPPRLDVEQQWSEAVSNLGLFAVYPPSEDVMVGDAFLYLPGAQFFDLVRVTAAPLPLLARQFCYQEQDRMVLDALSDGKSGVVKSASDKDACAFKAPAQGKPPERPQRIVAHDGAVTSAHVTRLREAAIPRLEVGRFTEGELAGAGLLGNFGAALGIGTSAKAAMRLELGNLQSAMLDELRGSRLLEDISVSRVRRVRGTREDYPNALTPLMLARSLQYADQRNGTTLSGQFCRGDFGEIDQKGVRLVVANRVLYAGSVTFDFLSERVLTARLALDFASVLAGMPQKPVVPALPGAPPAPGAGGGGGASPKEEFSPEVQLAAMMATANRILTLGADKAGQASARLTTGSFGSLAMQRTFVRPAAVGMGAALHVPIGDALVPVSGDQVVETIAYCQATHGTAGRALEERLWKNYAWAFYLHRREDEGATRRGSDPGTALAEAQAEVRRLRGDEAMSRVDEVPAERLRSGRLPALPANQRVRVRP